MSNENSDAFRRELSRTRDNVRFHAGDLPAFVSDQLRPRYRNIWVAGGGMVAGECIRRGLADEIRYSILPILIGDGISFFERIDRDVALHLAEVKAYKNGIVELRYTVHGRALHAKAQHVIACPTNRRMPWRLRCKKQRARNQVTGSGLLAANCWLLSASCAYPYPKLAES